jgi:SAM-dependent methyltransferase
MDILEWINSYLQPERCTSDKFIYDDMDSQSGQSLPIIYQPFDGSQRGHWRDRGSLFDFLYAVQGEGKKLLDFGPGDGWPSLILAPYAAEVVGVDGSSRRVAVCTANAARLGLTNARFIHVPAGSPLPFADNSFDGAMAASSIEQSPQPRRTLAELFRVLKPGGRLRIDYEALNGYRNGQEHAVWFGPINDRQCWLILYYRDIAGEQVLQYRLTLALPAKELEKMAAVPLTFDRVMLPLLEQARPGIIDARVCTTQHPSGKTLAAWLAEIGFREVIPSHAGNVFAGRLFDVLTERNRPQTLTEIDALLKPLVKVVVTMRAPLELDPPITAVK